MFSTLGSVLGWPPELEGQAARLRPLAIAGVLGGATGATLLLLTPSDTFERIAPWLIGAAWLAILVRPRVHPEHQRAAAGPGLAASMFAIAIYSSSSAPPAAIGFFFFFFCFSFFVFFVIMCMLLVQRIAL